MMRLIIKNSPAAYGWASIILHWSMALIVIGLFLLGKYMVDLTYYDPNYRDAPALHKSIGILLFFLLATRVSWHFYTGLPKPIASLRLWETQLSFITHKILYLLLIGTIVSGYLISTAKGQGISVFDWFTIPALPTLVTEQEEIAGDIHELLATGLLALASLHGCAALKHHVWDKDATLKRMLGISR